MWLSRFFRNVFAECYISVPLNITWGDFSARSVIAPSRRYHTVEVLLAVRAQVIYYIDIFMLFYMFELQGIKIFQSFKTSSCLTLFMQFNNIYVNWT